jgi:hypothetical protein
VGSFGAKHMAWVGGFCIKRDFYCRLNLTDLLLPLIAMLLLRCIENTFDEGYNRDFRALGPF